MDKITSGRWILTVTCGAVFAYATWAKLIPPDAVVSILTMVFVSYFHKSNPTGAEGNGSSRGTLGGEQK